MAELIDLTQLQAVLEEYARDVAEMYKANLVASDKMASHNLINSVQTRVVAGDTAYVVEMDVASYWKYVENDTQPHWPPSSAILQWIKIKPVIPTADAHGKIPTEKQLAFLISRKIATVGTKGTHDLEDAKKVTMDQYRERISKALGHDVQNYIAKVLR